MKKDKSTPSAEAIHGQPHDVFDMVNKYGTYNIQPTLDGENEYPSIGHALPDIKRDKRKCNDR